MVASSPLNIVISQCYRPFRLLEDEDNFDTDTGNIRLCWTFFINFTYWTYLSDVMAESTTTALNRWQQSSPIRSPWDVEQRLR